MTGRYEEQDQQSERIDELQFDLFARYSMLANIVRAVSKPDNGAQLIDVGAGFSQLTERFLPDHFGHIIRTDIEDFGDREIVVVPPGAALPFDNGTFACAAAMDVLEHMADDIRGNFIAECLRVAPRLTIIATPIGLPEITAAETIMAEGYRSLFGNQLAFLDEHNHFGLPRPEKITTIAHDLGAELVTVDSVRLPEWIVSNLIDLYCSTINDGGAAKRFMASRNSALYPLSGASSEQHYRRFYILTRDSDVALMLRTTFKIGLNDVDTASEKRPILLMAEQLRDYVATYNAPFIDAERADLRIQLTDSRTIRAEQAGHIGKLNAEIEKLIAALKAKDEHIDKLDASVAELSAKLEGRKKS